jgi:acetyl esterase/lipase
MSSAVVPEEVIVLWHEGAPGSEGWTQVEEELILPPDLRVVRNVTQPSLTVYPADPLTANGTAVIVCPGGAWHFLSIDKEGNDVARWLARRGVTAFVLRYRLLRTGDDVRAEMNANLSDPVRMERLMQTLQPLVQADGEQAVRLVRQRASGWGILPERVGMLGFSAGGDLTARAAQYNDPDCRPAFAAPIYPAVFEDVVAPPDAPPLFLLCANDDDMATAGSLRLYFAWKAVGRPVEMHIYSTGGHGFGMLQQGLPIDTWIERFGDWLGVQGLLERPAQTPPIPL